MDNQLGINLVYFYFPVYLTNSSSRMLLCE
jgi:hypothetical protein